MGPEGFNATADNSKDAKLRRIEQERKDNAQRVAQIAAEQANCEDRKRFDELEKELGQLLSRVNQLTNEYWELKGDDQE